jgi:hypothetical protein
LDELPNSSCYWALPGELLTAGVVTLALALAGTAAIDGPAPLSVCRHCRLPFSFGCHRSKLRWPVSYSLVVVSIADSLPLPLAFAMLSACSLFSCRDDALHWTWLPVLSTPWLIPIGLWSILLFRRAFSPVLLTPSALEANALTDHLLRFTTLAIATLIATPMVVTSSRIIRGISGTVHLLGSFGQFSCFGSGTPATSCHAKSCLNRDGCCCYQVVGLLFSPVHLFWPATLLSHVSLLQYV